MLTLFSEFRFETLHVVEAFPLDRTALEIFENALMGTPLLIKKRKRNRTGNKGVSVRWDIGRKVA